MKKHIYVLDEYITSTKNGIGVFIAEFLSCLKDMDVDICHIIFNVEQPEIKVYYKNGIEVISIPRFPSGDFFHNWKVANRLLRLLIQDSKNNIFCFNHSPCPELQKSLHVSHPLSKQIYIIHNFWWTLPLLGNDLLLIDIVKHKERSLKNTKHEWILDTIEKEKEMCQLADAVVCLAQSSFQILTNIYHINTKKIFLIPNGLRRNKYTNLKYNRHILREKFLVEEKEKVILFVGRLSESKGVDALLNAFKILLRSFSNIRLVLAGALSPDFDMTNYNHLSSKVTYTGHLNHKKLKEWYLMADIGVIPSYTEQCSYVGIEMMMYGLAIVASDGFGVRDMFYDGMNAIVASTGKQRQSEEFANNLAYALSQLLSSQDLADKLGTKAKKTYLNQYTTLKMRRKYKELFTVL